MLKHFWYSNNKQPLLFQQKGSILLVFAILLPIIFSLCALVFDGSRLLIKKARLSDALHEATLAIATASSEEPDNDDELEQLNKILVSYINNYLPEEKVTASQVKVEMKSLYGGSETPIFHTQASIEVNTLLPLEIAPSFLSQINVNSQANVVKLNKAADYVFLLDVSQRISYLSGNSGYTHQEAIKSLISMSDKILSEDARNTITIIPFDNGVPVYNPKTYSYPNIDLTVPVFSCSALMVPQKLTNSNMGLDAGFDIDYAFWAPRFAIQWQGWREVNVNGTKTWQYKTWGDGKNLQEIKDLTDLGENYYSMEYFRYLFYRTAEDALIKVLSFPSGLVRSKVLDSYAELNLGYCTKKELIDVPSYPISMFNLYHLCDTPISEQKTQSLSHGLDDMLNKDLLKLLQVNKNGYNGILTPTSMDINATLSGMFDPANIITFDMNPQDTQIKGQGRNNLFFTMCSSAGHHYDRFYPKSSKHVDGYASLNKQGRFFYMIEQTRDKDKLKAELTRWLTIPITSAGPEYLNSDFYSAYERTKNTPLAILRAVPELTKGSNRNKVLVITSFGEDSDNGNAVRDSLLKNRNQGDGLCDHIRKGVKSKTGADVEIFYLTNRQYYGDATAADKEAQQYWSTYCTDSGKTKAGKIQDTLPSIYKQFSNNMDYEETGRFVN